MVAMVHRQSGDAVAGMHPQRFERLCHAPGIMSDIAPVGAGGGAIGPGRDDFAVRMFAFGMVDQPHDAERPILHRTKSQFATPSSQRPNSVAAERRADKRFAYLLAGDSNLAN